MRLLTCEGCTRILIYGLRSFRGYMCGCVAKNKRPHKTTILIET